MAVFNVANAAQFKSALAQASGGDTIRLAPGNYGAVTMEAATQKNLKFGSTVTITSANSGQPAVISNLKMTGASNIKFDGIKFDFVAQNSPNGANPFTVFGSSKITFQNSVFDGHLQNGYGVGTGLNISTSSQITVQNTEFLNFLRNFSARKITDLTVVNNEVHSMSGDGMTFAEVKNALIANNHLHSMKGNPASNYHKDMIQFWTTSTSSPSSNVTIRNNTIDSGDSSSHSMFIANELVETGKAGAGMYYQNMLIENNTIVGGQFHGITVGASNGLAIKNNTVVHDPVTGNKTSSNWITKINVSEASTGVSITGNTAHGVNVLKANNLGQPVATSKAGWNISSNKLVANGYDVATSSPITKAPVAVEPVVTAPEVKEAPVSTPAPSVTPPAETALSAPAPSAAGGGDLPLAELAKAQSQAFYQQLAKDYGLTVKTGTGDSGDNIVFARPSDGLLNPGAGNDVLIGNAGKNWFMESAGDNVFVGFGGADAFRFDGRHVSGTKSDAILDVNFSQGDTITFRQYDAGTFSHLPGKNLFAVFDGGKSAAVDTILDLREMVEASKGITAKTEGGALVLSISQGADTHELYLAGLASAYQGVSLDVL